VAAGNAEASASRRGPTAAPSTRTAIGWASGLSSRSSASPRRPVTMPIARLPLRVMDGAGATGSSRSRTAASVAPRPTAPVAARTAS
jgi:hypothetical protein